MLKTGKDHLEGLRDGRTIYIGSEKVTDVTTHPAFAHAAQTVAGLYDAKCAKENLDLFSYEEDGERYSLWYLRAKTKDDLRRRMNCHTSIAYTLVNTSQSSGPRRRITSAQSSTRRRAMTGSRTTSRPTALKALLSGPSGSSSRVTQTLTTHLRDRGSIDQPAAVRSTADRHRPLGLPPYAGRRR